MIIKKRGGQVAIEFIFLIAIAFTVSIIFSYAIVDQAVDLNDQKEFVAVQDIAFKIQGELNIAATTESGYQRDFELPIIAHFVDYNATILNNSLIITSANKEYILTVPDVIGQPKKGWNRICKANGNISLESGSCIYT